MESSRFSDLREQIVAACRARHLGLDTERRHVAWARHFAMFHDGRDLRQVEIGEISAYLEHLANKLHLAPSVQNQALAAIVFVYRELLHIDLPWLDGVAQVERPPRRPVVLSETQVRRLLSQLDGVYQLAASVLYGSGMRLMEVVRLRVGDIDLDALELTVRANTGDIDRVTPVPCFLAEPLAEQLERVAVLHARDRRNGLGPAYLPRSLRRRFPQGGLALEWQYVFPASKASRDRRHSCWRRHHIEAVGLERAVKSAARRAGVGAAVTSHALRDSFASHLLGHGYALRTVQKLLGHKDLKSTEIYMDSLGGAGIVGVRGRLELCARPACLCFARV